MNIVFLTGAGISSESGLSTYRDLEGIWKEYKCWIDELGYLFYFGEPEDTSFRLGKIYYRELSKFYHIKYTKSNSKYEGSRDFKELILIVLKGENII